MREINGFMLYETAIPIGPNNYRPGFDVRSAAGEQTALLEVGYSGDQQMNEEDALNAARACLVDVVAVGDDGHRVWLSDGAIQVRLVPVPLTGQRRPE